MGRTKLVYTCSYDGNLCDKVIPKFDEEGCLIPESNKELFEKYGKIINRDELERSWDICDNCSRNHTISGVNSGKLKCEGFSIDKY